MNELINVALIGTAKASDQLLDTPASLPGKWDALAIDREKELLLRSGAIATLRRAGARTEPGIDLPDAAPPDHLPVCASSIAKLVESFLAANNTHMLHEVLMLIRERKQRLPETTLPHVLNARNGDVRKAARPLLGERGFWLSTFNPDWAWAREGVAQTLPRNAFDIWQEGTPQQRLATLRVARSQRPDEARRWLEQVWREEKAEFRKDALDILRTDLSLDDEPMLERALDDRAQGVREVAASLLASLPESALVKRMCERADQMLHYTPAAPANLLRKIVRSMTAASTHGTFAVTLPTVLDASWKRDGIDDNAPRGVGSGSWIFANVLAMVPLRHWEHRWNVEPGELVASAAVTQENGLAILHGWSLAALKSGDIRWALALWNAWASRKTGEHFHDHARVGFLSDLLRVLPPEHILSFAEERLARATPPPEVFTAIITALPKPWSTQCSALILDRIHSHAEKNIDHSTREWLSLAAIAVPRRHLEPALERFGPLFDKTQNWILRHFVETIETRQQIYREIDR